MLGVKGNSKSQVLTCCLGEKSYSFSRVQDNYRLMLCERRELPEKELLAKAFADDVERLNLIGKSCKMILTPGQYQLLLMDAMEVSEEEMAKAIRWRLKGLVDYPLNDLAIDLFLVPPHGVVGQRKKVFVAAASLTELKAKVDLFESAYLQVNSIEISELALRNALSFLPDGNGAPIIAISFEEDVCKLLIIYDQNLYLIRDLGLTPEAAIANSPQSHNILLEIQRSIDYCLSELKLPEPQRIVFTPSFYEAGELLQFLRSELSKEIMLFDLSDYLEMDPRLELKEQKGCFYSIGGAISLRVPEGE